MNIIKNVKSVVKNKNTQRILLLFIVLFCAKMIMNSLKIYFFVSTSQIIISFPTRNSKDFVVRYDNVKSEYCSIKNNKSDRIEIIIDDINDYNNVKKKYGVTIKIDDLNKFTMVLTNKMILSDLYYYPYRKINGKKVGIVESFYVENKEDELIKFIRAYYEDVNYFEKVCKIYYLKRNEDIKWYKSDEIRDEIYAENWYYRELR